MAQIPYVDIFDLDLPDDEFDFANYREGERDILAPALRKAGYTIDGRWFSVEADSFGPLVRGVHATAPDLRHIILYYG